MLRVAKVEDFLFDDFVCCDRWEVRQSKFQLTPPMIESDQELASLIRQVGVTSITDIDQLIGELEEARDYLKSEEERIRAETARYTALTQAASASVKIIFDAVRDWRKTGHSDRNQSRMSVLAITDAEQLDER